MDEKFIFGFNLLGAIYENAAKIKSCSDTDNAVIGLPVMRTEYSISDEELKEFCEVSSLDETLIEELEEIVEREIRACFIQAKCNNGYADISLTLIYEIFQ